MMQILSTHISFVEQLFLPPLRGKVRMGGKHNQTRRFAQNLRNEIDAVATAILDVCFEK